MTTASYIRKFVDQNPNYDHDSQINPQTAYDLLIQLHQIQKGDSKAEELLGLDYDPVDLI